MYELLYTKVNRSEADFEQDLITIREQKIIKLKNPDNYDDILYIPEFIISEVPNYNVKKYAKLVLALPIGVYPGEEEHVKEFKRIMQKFEGSYVPIIADLEFTTTTWADKEEMEDIV